MSDMQFIFIVILLALSVMICRYLPFIIFKDSDRLPDLISYLGKYLPSAMMGLLVVYCFKDYDFLAFDETVSALLAGGVVVIVHLYKRNTILSILAGTITYMILLNNLF